MGLLSNTINICQFRAVGERPSQDPFEWASERLAKNSFQSIDQTTDEVSSGWVHIDDSTENSFAHPRAFLRDHYLAMTLRRDQRRVPSVVFRLISRTQNGSFLGRTRACAGSPSRSEKS